MINLKDIKSAKHISDPTEEKLNDLKLVSQETDKEIVSTQGENTKDILRARSIERLDALNVGSEAFDDKIGERETSVTEELTEIIDRTETVISDSEKYTEDIEAFLSVAKGDDFLFFLDDCTRAVGRLDKLTNGSYLCYGKKITSWDIPLPVLENGESFFNKTLIVKLNIQLPLLTNGTNMFHTCKLTNFDIDMPFLSNGTGMFHSNKSMVTFKSDMPKLINGLGMFEYSNRITHFKSNLSSLQNGDRMFNGCILDLESVKNIAGAIKDISSEGRNVTLTLGMSKSIKNDAELADALSMIRDKGWIVVEQYNL